MEQYLLILPRKIAQAESGQLENVNRQKCFGLLQIFKGNKVKSLTFEEHFCHCKSLLLSYCLRIFNTFFSPLEMNIGVTRDFSILSTIHFH